MEFKCKFCRKKLSLQNQDTIEFCPFTGLFTCLECVYKETLDENYQFKLRCCNECKIVANFPDKLVIKIKNMLEDEFTINDVIQTFSDEFYLSRYCDFLGGMYQHYGKELIVNKQNLLRGINYE